MSKRVLINFGDLPLVNTLSKNKTDKENIYPLVVGFDDDTKLVSLINNADQELLFPDDYVYDSSQSTTMVKYFENTAIYLKDRFNPDKVLEIGSNSGIFIKHFLDRKPIAVEPCQNFADRTNEMGIRTESSFWDTGLAKDMLSVHGKQDLVYSANTMTHVHDLEDALKGVYDILDDEGIFVIDGPALKWIIQRNAFDQFYHEHQSYFSLLALMNILKPIGFRIIDVIQTQVHGGSYQIFISKIHSQHEINQNGVMGAIFEERNLGLDNYDMLIQHFGVMASHIVDIKKTISDLVAFKNNTVVGYGATAKFTQVCNMCGLDWTDIKFVVDTTPEKQGMWIPNTGIPIIEYTPNEWHDGVKYAYLGAWNYEKEITDKEWEYMDKGGKFISHVPVVHFVSHIKGI